MTTALKKPLIAAALTCAAAFAPAAQAMSFDDVVNAIESGADRLQNKIENLTAAKPAPAKDDPKAPTMIQLQHRFEPAVNMLPEMAACTADGYLLTVPSMVYRDKTEAHARDVRAAVIAAANRRERAAHGDQARLSAELAPVDVEQFARDQLQIFQSVVGTQNAAAFRDDVDWPVKIQQNKAWDFVPPDRDAAGNDIAMRKVNRALFESARAQKSHTNVTLVVIEQDPVLSAARSEKCAAPALSR